MLIIRYFTLITISILLIFNGVLPAQPLSFNLKEAGEYAVKNSYSVQNARYDLEIARKKVKENLSFGFPQIDGTVDYSYFIALPTSLIPGDFFGQPGEMIEVQFGTKNNLTAGVTLNQLIFDGRYFIGLQYAKIFEQISAENLEKSEEDIRETVSRTYFSILVGEESLKILDSTLVILMETLYQTEELYKEGFAERTDFDQLKITVTDLQNMINLQRRQNELGYKLLKYQMGLDLSQEILLTETLDGLINDAGISALAEQQFNPANHIDYRLISTQEKMQVLSLKNERAAYYPKLNGFVFLQENAQRDSFDFFDIDQPWFMTSSTGVSLKIPVFSSGYRKSRVGQAKLELEKIRLTKNQVQAGLELSALQSRSAFITALENYFRDKQNIGLALDIYSRTLIKYKEGVATSVELTQQHQQFFNAESKYFQTVFNLLDAKNMLDKALGNY
ncbi:MAG TPA: TolC family protein [Bacteroidales bacterium]|nr:TolC family protein [Bacteroidales bacterium]HOX78493.1 TolC family protein [Bacteroidales bacterium]HPM91333.1 TolC family protein [Bacteroidales bacterium]